MGATRRRALRRRIDARIGKGVDVRLQLDKTRAASAMPAVLVVVLDARPEGG
jgi:hypothetical protein